MTGPFFHAASHHFYGALDLQPAYNVNKELHKSMGRYYCKTQRFRKFKTNYICQKQNKNKISLFQQTEFNIQSSVLRKRNHKTSLILKTE